MCIAAQDDEAKWATERERTEETKERYCPDEKMSYQLEEIIMGKQTHTHPTTTNDVQILHFHGKPFTLLFF